MNVSDDESKFNLFVKSREVKQIFSTLQTVVAMPRSAREQWIKDNGDILQKAFDNLIDDSNQLFTDMIFDAEALELSQELIVSLRDTVYLIETITSEKAKLIS